MLHSVSSRLGHLDAGYDHVSISNGRGFVQVEGLLDFCQAFSEGLLDFKEEAVIFIIIFADIDECIMAVLDNSQPCDDVSMLCINLPGSFFCTCPEETYLVNGECRERGE